MTKPAARMSSETVFPTMAAVVAGYVMVIGNLAGFKLPPVIWVLIFAVYFASSFRFLKRGGLIVIAIAVALYGLAWVYTGEAGLKGLSSAGFLFIFLMVMQHMADLAARSPRIAEAAELIVSRPPGQRYLFVTFGTHVFALFLNIGAVILITTLLSSRLKGAGESSQRSLAIASSRGFASTALWSPVSLCSLIVFTHVTGVTYAEFVPYGILCMLFFLMTGYWLERGRRSAVVNTEGLSLDDTFKLLRVVGLAMVLVVGGLLWVSVFDVRLIEAMFSVVFILGAIWTVLFVRAGHTNVRSLVKDYARATSGLANETAIISGATVIGAAASSLVGQWVGFQGELSAVTATWVAAVIPVTVFAAGLLAINPVVTVTVLASSLNPVWPDAAKMILVLAMSWGWSISGGGTPFTANVAIAAQKFGQTGFTVAMKWNGMFLALMLSIATLAAAAGMVWLAG
ncbi:hypothetical protein [Roseibium aggregatum]|uniref:Uncharacterized protein n=1 Tax=Roseibium aggregatum TaxID=187304 RepID=A0A926S6P1_9HYPH|nr:hypothetical protein [Roseibium aggregatum]MBD1547776.1 hypothetical protein [Roseibium aggregatum]